MAAISSLQIGGTTYDIYAKSAEQAPVGSHELSSHSHFSTYFNGTSANSALTSKSALSAGSASKAVSASGADSASFALSSNTARNGNFYEDTVGIPANFNAASTYAVGAQVSTAGYCYSASAAVGKAGAWSAVSSKFARLTQVNWTITDTSITGLYKGLQLWVKLPSYGGSSGSNATMLNINSSGAKQVRINNGNYTTHYSSGTVIHLTYDGTYFQVGDRTDGNDRVGQYSATDSQNYPIILKRTTGGQETQTVKYASAFTYNPSTSSLKVSNISSNNITATTFSGNLSGKASDSDKLAGSAASTYIQTGNSNAQITAVSAKAAPVASHNHNYTISGGTNPFNVSAGIQLSAGANIQITSAGTKAIGISAKDTTYTTANFITANKTVGVSSNGNNVGTVNLSGISFSAGTNVTLGKSTNVITITAKDTTYTSLNGINSTEYNALTSTSGNSRTPAAHQLSSHTNFTTYFDGTSAKKAQTAGSAGTAYTTQNVGNVGSATLIGSAKSGQSAYDWITTKSAALSAGSGIKFTSASANTLGICVTGILTTTDLNAWSSNIFSGNSARSAVSAKSAVSAGSATNAAKLGNTNATAVTGSAAAGSAASAWINSHSGTMIEAGYGIGTAYNETTEKYTVGIIQSHCQGGNVANDDYSLALGAYSEASGGYNGMASFAFGWLCKATGPNTIAMGYSAEAKAYASYAIGYLISASGQYSILLGYDNVSTANYTYHLGRNLSSNNWGVVLGRWNTPVNNADLIVGNGTANNARSNAMIISGGCVSATTYLGVFSGNISGSAASALTSKSLYVANHETNDTTYYPVWANGTLNNNRDIYGSSSKLQWNPKSGRLYVSNIVKVGGCSMTWNSSTSALDFNF